MFEDSNITPRHMFLSVHDAVLFAQHKSLIPVTMEQVNQKSNDKGSLLFAMVIFIYLIIVSDTYSRLVWSNTRVGRVYFKIYSKSIANYLFKM